MIVVRTPIVDRFPVIDRCPIIDLDYDRFCFLDGVKSKEVFHIVKVSGGYELCIPFIQGKEAAEVIKGLNKLLDEVEAIPYMYIDLDSYEDKEVLNLLLQDLSIRNINCWFISRRSYIPENVLSAIQGNVHNIVQFNINPNREDTEALTSIGRYLYDFKSWGVYTVIRVSPIIPNFTKVHHMMQITDMFKNSCNVVCLMFSSYDEKYCTNAMGLMNTYLNNKSMKLTVCDFNNCECLGTELCKSRAIDESGVYFPVK